MATPNQYAIREVALATFYSLVDNSALFHLNNLKTSGLENSANTVYARGGRGNAKIVGFSSDREAKIKLEDAVFTTEAIAMMTGNNIATGAQNIYKREVLTVASDAASLSKTPVGGVLISLYKLNADGSHGDAMTKVAATPAAKEYTLTAKALAFEGAEFTDGAKVVAYYQVATDATSKKVTVSSDKFAGSFKLVLDCLVRDTFTKQDYAAQIIIPTAKMEDSWSITMAADGDPSVFSMPIEILKPATSTDMWTMTVYDESLVS